MTGTKAERAAVYFGRSNTDNKTGVDLGRYQYGFVGPTSLWFYDEEFGPRGFTVRLPPARRERLIAALVAETP